MMGLDNLRAGEQISAADVRALAAQVARSRPALGSGALTTSGGTAPIKDGTDLFLAKVTAVSGTGAAATYSFVEQNVAGHAGDIEDRGSPRRADKDKNAARCVLVGVTLAVDDIVLARRNVAFPEEWELIPLAAGGVSEWKWYRITGRTPAAIPNTPPLYNWEEVKLVLDADPGTIGNQTDWIPVDPPNTGGNAVRAPSKDWDEGRDGSTRLPAIPNGQVMLGRPSVTNPGYHELLPWGGEKKIVKNELIDVCTRCVEDPPGSGTFVIKTKVVHRHVRHYARDLRAAILDPYTLEEEVLDTETT